MSASDTEQASGGLLQIEMVYALSERQWRVPLTLAQGATVADALTAVADREPFANLDLVNLPVGIYGELVSRSGCSRIAIGWRCIGRCRSIRQRPGACAARANAEPPEGRGQVGFAMVSGTSGGVIAVGA